MKRLGYTGVSLGHHEEQTLFTGLYQPDNPASHSDVQNPTAETRKLLRSQKRMLNDVPQLHRLPRPLSSPHVEVVHQGGRRPTVKDLPRLPAICSLHQEPAQLHGLGRRRHDLSPHRPTRVVPSRRGSLPEVPGRWHDGAPAGPRRLPGAHHRSRAGPHPSQSDRQGEEQRSQRRDDCPRRLVGVHSQP